MSRNCVAVKVSLSTNPVGETDLSAETVDLRTLVGHTRKD